MKKSVIILGMLVVCLFFTINSVIAYQEISFDSTGITSKTMALEGQSYTIELVTASTTTATISVTNSAGIIEQKDITELQSKIVNGIQIYVKTADSNNVKYMSTIVVSPKPDPNDINFDSTGITSTELIVDGKKYIIELVTSSTTSATISVTAPDGTSEQKEITEGLTKIINKIAIYVRSADSNNIKYTATIQVSPKPEPNDIILSSTSPSKTVSVEGKLYVVELISATPTSATLSVRSSDGIIEQKDISEGSSKIINGIQVYVKFADSNNAIYTTIIQVSPKPDPNDINFDSTGTTSTELIVDGKKYTIELVTASSITATIAVTAPDGTEEQKEITEGYTKVINSLNINVRSADSNNIKYTATIQVSPKPEPNDILLDSSGVTSKQVVVGGKTYTIELVGASSSTAIATISVIDSDRNSERKDISVGTTKIVNGIQVYVKSASSNNQVYTAIVQVSPKPVDTNDIVLDSSGTASKSVTIDGKTYTVELVSASSSTAIATISVTNSERTSERKDISVGTSKIVNGISVYVKSADSNNQKYTATIQVSAYTPAPAPTPTPNPPTPSPSPTPVTPSDEISLNSINPTKFVDVGGANYTIELITASTSSATISIKKSDGTTEQKEITEGYSKIVNGVSVYVKSADSNNQGYNTIVILKPFIQNNECSPVGLRNNNKKYCSIDTSWLDEKKTGISCDNNFECESNLCINSKCFSGSLWDKIVSWFSKLFGGK